MFDKYENMKPRSFSWTDIYTHQQHRKTRTTAENQKLDTEGIYPIGRRIFQTPDKLRGLNLDWNFSDHESLQSNLTYKHDQTIGLDDNNKLNNTFERHKPNTKHVRVRSGQGMSQHFDNNKNGYSMIGVRTQDLKLRPPKFTGKKGENVRHFFQDLRNSRLLHWKLLTTLLHMRM